MSHLGFRILYDIINNLPYASGERVFSPWIDLEAYMKKNGILLSSLESRTALRDFDIAGFSLQYELSYTTLLNLLSLGGIPLRSEERQSGKRRFPLVIAGGPCTVNPKPMSVFIDAFLVGDGEEAIIELIEAVRQWKIEGDNRRESILEKVAQLEGFLVPSIQKSHGKVRRRIVTDLENAPYPVKPIVPYASIIHDRVTIEVSRGCTMGCRFCQAGMIYRPLRERSPQKILKIAEESLKNTGYDEVSFTSLSAGDYTCLLPLVKEFNVRFGPSKIAMSLPSLRVAAINKDVLKEIKAVKKTGFTMAPEAATERLRSVINKDFSDDDYERALMALFEEGWLNLKLYFMIGLPTEKDEDIEAIRDVAFKALRIAKRYTGRFVNIGITISPFIPKSHTPFQWHGQIGLDEMKRKLRYLRKVFTGRNFTYKGHNEEMSLLEAMIARGDEKLADLIEKAWQSGCRLDGWSEVFDFNKWLDAMEATGIDGPSHASTKFLRDEELPWDNVDIGIKKAFLYREYEKAIEGERTKNCRSVCTACGLICSSTEALREPNSEGRATEVKASQSLTLTSSQPPRLRVRARFSKDTNLCQLSHLELVSVILRGLRRAEAPLNFSKGFHPLPKVSFGPPLNVGVAGQKEYFDMEVFAPFDPEVFTVKLNDTMPRGIVIDKMSAVPANEPALSNFITRYEYHVTLKEGRKKPLEDAGSSSGSELAYFQFPLADVIVRRDGKETDLTPCIESVTILEGSPSNGGGLSMKLILKDYDGVKVRIGEIVSALFGERAHGLTIVRTALYGWHDDWREPL